MTVAMRTSPVHYQLSGLHPQWGEVNGMTIALRIGDGAATLPVALTDTSCLRRCGVKGPTAAAWLEALDVRTPAQINTWRETPGGGLLGRLGGSEFFIEDGFGGGSCDRIVAALKAGTPGLYPVMRQDASFALGGARANELLVQVCSFNFKTLDLAQQPLVMTMMVGVGVLVIAQPHGDDRLYRLWCDSTYGPYLWETLLGIARELGGGAVGLQQMFAQAGMGTGT